MSANVFGGLTAAPSTRTPAWRMIGQSFEGPTSASQANVQADLNYRVTKEPLYAHIDTPPFGTASVEVPNRFALMREATQADPQHRCFGIVSSTYNVLQNEDIARFLDPLTERWPIDTAGGLGYGETVFYSMKSGSHQVKGEELDLYFLVTDTKDGGSSLRIAFTPVRVWCKNTLLAGLRQSVVDVALSHHQDVTRELDFRMKLLHQMQDLQATMVGSFTRMAETVLLPHNVDEILKLVYPEPARPRKAQLVLDELGDDERAMLPGEVLSEATDIQGRYEYYANLSGVRRESVKTLLGRFNDEFPKTANTAWALYNTVVENEDFRTGPESMFESALFGKRAATKRRAFGLVFALVGKNPTTPAEPVLDIPRRGRPRKSK
jgi:hypothetical protein